MPMYWADYLADTRHLTTLEHGAYILLLATYWQRGEAIPDDNRFLARVTNLHHHRWGTVRKTLEGLFTVTNGVWVHKRVEEELLRSSARSQAGIRANSVRWQSGVQVTVTDTVVSKKEEREDTPSGNSAGKYAYENGIIKLKAADLERWRKSFPNINIEGAMENLVGWVTEEAGKGKNWFLALAGALGKRDQEAAERKIAAATPKPAVAGHGPWSNH